MLNEKIQWNATELNLGSGIIKSISTTNIHDPNSPHGEVVFNYVPRTAIVDNYSGDRIGYNILTDNEYNFWIVSGTISNYISLPNGSRETINDLEGNINKVIVTGEGTHTSGVIINLLKEK